MAKKKTAEKKRAGAAAKRVKPPKPPAKAKARREPAGRPAKPVRPKPATLKAAGTKPAAPAPVRPAPERDAGRLPSPEVAKPLAAKDRRAFRDSLVRLHDKITGQITFLASDNLNQSGRDSSGDLSRYSTHMADQGTDNFDRELALSLVSTEQDMLFEIDEALQRIELGTYGVCESCGHPVEKGRLEALPFARMCVKCQSANEKGKSKFRPGESGIAQNADRLTTGAAETAEPDES